MEEKPNFPMDADYYMENGFLVFTESYHIKEATAAVLHADIAHMNMKM